MVAVHGTVKNSPRKSHAYLSMRLRTVSSKRGPTAGAFCTEKHGKGSLSAITSRANSLPTDSPPVEALPELLNVDNNAPPHPLLSSSSRKSKLRATEFTELSDTCLGNMCVKGTSQCRAIQKNTNPTSSWHPQLPSAGLLLRSNYTW
jgi:hypothetical protein